MNFVYLASPYTILNTEGLSDRALKGRRARRFEQVCRKAADLMLQGEMVFCPIAHSHSVEVNGMDKIYDGEFLAQAGFRNSSACQEACCLSNGGMGAITRCGRGN